MKSLFLAALVAVFGLTQTAQALPLAAGDVEFLLNRMPGAVQKVQLGTLVTRNKVQVMRAVYDYAKLGGSTTTLSLLDADGKPAVLPAKAIIKQVIVDGVTSLVSAGTTNIVLGASTSNDLKTSTAHTSFTGTALLAGTPVGTAATMLQYSAATTVKAGLSGSALTSGKFNVIIEYYLTN